MRIRYFAAKDKYCWSLGEDYDESLSLGGLGNGVYCSMNICRGEDESTVCLIISSEFDVAIRF